MKSTIKELTVRLTLGTCAGVVLWFASPVLGIAVGLLVVVLLPGD